MQNDQRYADINAPERRYPPITRSEAHRMAQRILRALGSNQQCSVTGIDDETGKPLLPARSMLDRGREARCARRWQCWPVVRRQNRVARCVDRCECCECHQQQVEGVRAVRTYLIHPQPHILAILERNGKLTMGMWPFGAAVSGAERDLHRRAYTRADAQAVVDWLNNREVPK